MRITEKQLVIFRLQLLLMKAKYIQKDIKYLLNK